MPDYVCYVCGGIADPAVLADGDIICEACDEATPDEPIAWLKSFSIDNPNERIAIRKALEALEEHEAWRSQLSQLRAQNRNLQDQLEQVEDLRDRMSELLDLTANALKGDPTPNHTHLWADLPKVAAELRAQIQEQ